MAQTGLLTGMTIGKTFGFTLRVLPCVCKNPCILDPCFGPSFCVTFRAFREDLFDIAMKNLEVILL